MSVERTREVMMHYWRDDDFNMIYEGKTEPLHTERQATPIR